MPVVTIEQLEKELNKGELQSSYLLYGVEKFLLENCLKKIKKIFGDLVLGINYVVIDENNFTSLISNLETPAFGYEKKLVIVKNAGLLKKEGKRKNASLADSREKIVEYLDKNKDIVLQTNCIVFLEEDIEKNNLYKELEKIGAVICNFEEQKLPVLVSRIKSLCMAYHVNVDDNTIKYFIETCGTNMQELINELRKLIEYVGENGTIQKNDIDKLCNKKIEAVIFDLTDELGKKNISKAITVLHKLKYNKEPIPKIIITLYNHFKKLFLVKLALKEQKDISLVLKLKPNQTFLMGKYKTQAGYFKESELKKLLEELTNLDMYYKNGIIDEEIGLESILCRYCS